MERRVAVITGASRGIGAYLAQDFLDRGVSVGICSRSQTSLADHPNALWEAVDVSSATAVGDFRKKVQERFGPIGLWINNAGILGPVAPLRSVSPEDFSQTLRINVEGVFNGSHAYVTHLRETKTEGVLINISSGAGRNGYAGWSAYCSSKAAVDLLTECVQLEEAEIGLRAYAVAPGVIDTDMQTEIRKHSREDFPTVEKFVALKRDKGFDDIDAVAKKLFAIGFENERPNDVRIDLRH